MISIEETAYPRLRNSYTKTELEKIYLLTEEEITFIEQASRGRYSRISLAVQFKCTQRLGYFCSLEQIPSVIINYVSNQLGFSVDSKKVIQNKQSYATKKRHQQLIKKRLNLKPFGETAKKLVIQTMTTSAKTKDEPSDLVNDSLEMLAKERYLFPPFQLLKTLSKRIRAASYLHSYKIIDSQLSSKDKNMIQELFIFSEEKGYSMWNKIKEDSKNATLYHLRELIETKEFLQTFNFSFDLEAFVPLQKIEQMSMEANVSNASQMRSLNFVKANSLAIAFLKKVTNRCNDDLADMFIKRILAIHTKGKQKLAEHKEQTQQQTNELIKKFYNILSIYHTDQDPSIDKLTTIDTLLKKDSVDNLKACEDYLAYSKNNYLPFLPNIYKSHRSVLFKVLEQLIIYSTSLDKSLEKAVIFLRKYRSSKKELIDSQGLDLSFLSTKWTQWIFNKDKKLPGYIYRKRLEIAIFTEVAGQLKTGDICINNSTKYSDYRKQLVDWDYFYQNKSGMCELMSFEESNESFVATIKEKFYQVAKSVDEKIPENEDLVIENNKILLKKVKQAPRSKELLELESYLENNISFVTILELMTDTFRWTNLPRFFGPISRYEHKLEDPMKSYLATTFCYGTNLGAAQTAKSLREVSRRHLAWINQRHITSESLGKAINLLINSYNRFALPKYWGNGSSASADGMKWNVYEQNLLSEYHVRYGGYGGIGYYHVSDTYIALFSNFIPCGVWEGVYILDLLMNQENVTISPEMIHADTQGQSEVIFGLSFLLGIELMPRIRNLNELKFYHPDPSKPFECLEELLVEEIDWALISKHYDDMLRVVMSIKEGKISPSTILNRLTSYSKKNKLYRAFRELGRAVRTQFLLRYISSLPLRKFIQGATNKSESFNNFLQWSFFGGDQVLKENNRESQKKMIKYNHLVANCIIFYNVFEISRVLQKYTVETGKQISAETVKKLSPYITSHINRFGTYELNLDRESLEIKYDLDPFNA